MSGFQGFRLYKAWDPTGTDRRVPVRSCSRASPQLTKAKQWNLSMLPPEANVAKWKLAHTWGSGFGAYGGVQYRATCRKPKNHLNPNLTPSSAQNLVRSRLGRTCAARPFFG